MISETFASTPAPGEDRFACGACGQPFRRVELRAGRGRHLGEHPEHEYAPCGHSITWYGSRRLRTCAHCGAPLPGAAPRHVVECDACYEWLNSTCGEDIHSGEPEVFHILDLVEVEA